MWALALSLISPVGILPTIYLTGRPADRFNPDTRAGARAGRDARHQEGRDGAHPRSAAPRVSLVDLSNLGSEIPAFAGMTDAGMTEEAAPEMTGTPHLR